MKAVRFDAEAKIEYDGALAASPDPRSFQRKVDDALSAIARGFIVHRSVARSGIVRECVLSHLPYSIVYLDEPDTIRIVAFVHKKRRRGYWKPRLKPS
jgi:hypothetical protein